MVDPAYMRAAFKTLAGLDDEKYVTLKIGWASSRIDPTFWLLLKDQAVALLAAHFIEIDNRAGQGGFITSEKVGDLSRNFENALKTDALAATSYGIEYLALLQTIPSTPLAG